MASLPPEKIFKSYDIRGVYPTDINEDNIITVTKAIYKFFSQKITKSGFSVVLSRDMRTSSPSLYEAVKKTLLEAGAQIIDIGITSTPTFYFAVSHYGYDSGIQITASHNPKEWNGMKFVINTPSGLLKIGKPTGMEDIKKMATTGVELPAASTPGTIIEKADVVIDEVTEGLKALGNPTLKKFKIVADPANAMGATYIEAIEKVVPMELIKMNFELDGNFPVHQPDPMQPENLVDAQKKLAEEKADLALVPDGDGDRLFIIDEKGQVVLPSMIVGILAKELLAKKPGSKVVVDLKFILNAKKIVEEYGGELLISKTGHAFITELMTREGALFAGEASAHYYYNFTGNAESQVTTILSVLKIMSEENKPLSEIAEEFRRCYESGEINFEVHNGNEIIEKVKAKYTDGEVWTFDGVSVNYPDWRFVVRPSNTEPLLRVTVEAYDKAIMEQKRDELLTLIKQEAKG